MGGEDSKVVAILCLGSGYPTTAMDPNHSLPSFSCPQTFGKIYVEKTIGILIVISNVKHLIDSVRWNQSGKLSICLVRIHFKNPAYQSGAGPGAEPEERPKCQSKHEQDADNQCHYSHPTTLILWGMSGL